MGSIYLASFSFTLSFSLVALKVLTICLKTAVCNQFISLLTLLLIALICQVFSFRFLLNILGVVSFYWQYLLQTICFSVNKTKNCYFLKMFQMQFSFLPFQQAEVSVIK